MKSFDELTIADDFMFCVIMQKKKICKQVLQATLGNKIGEIKNITYQRTLRETLEAKSVRFHVLAKDEQNCIYNIEMQLAHKQNIPLRMHYYSTTIDYSFLNKGADYETLPETFVIFFCDFDPLGKALPQYTIKSFVCEDKTILFNDKRTSVIVTKFADEKSCEQRSR